ncbi:MAG: nucleoside transporter C-terminal domain-containing protein [Verrucomicrobiota bacterium]
MPLRLISAFGLVVMIACAWLLSRDRKHFPWRTVLWGLGLQFLIAIFILKTPMGLTLFAVAQRAIDKLNVFAIEGAQMVFGPLANSDSLKSAFGAGKSYVFAVSISATIIVISALSSLFYHWGILQRVVHGMAWVMRSAMRTSGSESLGAASNIFMGQTEAALLIKPYIPHMTMSELMALMTTGMATIASGVMIVYAQMGIDAGHLLTASALSAPAGLLIAKIMFPETELSETRSTAPTSVKKTTVNSIDALCRGAGEGIALAINVIGMLIAFVAAVALANYALSLVQRPFGVSHPLTFQNLLGYLNWPFAWIMGITPKDCQIVAQTLGERVVLNEFIGYLSLTQQKAQLDPRSVTLATYALCGFANFSSIAIQIGGIGVLAPDRRADLARLGLRAMIAGLLACYLTATVVGVLI